MPSSPNRYTAVIDLTTRAQENASAERAAATYTGTGETLPEVDLGSVPESVRHAATAAGWKSLMPVQARTIPYLLAKQDLIIQSRTGSGKTGAFLLPLFELIDVTRPEVQALILSPTRELAKQIYDEFERMKQGNALAAGLDAAIIYGGVKYAPQLKSLKGGAQLVIGTPGRILDHLERRTFSLNALKVLILDEADEMLSMGFYPAMKEMRRYLPRERQSYMFSATMPPRVRVLAREFLNEPGFLSLSGGQVSVQEIEHRYHVVDPMEKDRALARVIEMENPESAIIFVNTKKEVEYLSTFLKNYGYDAAAISGDLNQQEREQVMGRIRKGNLRFLVATDVAARGIDISDLSHVLMYDVPQDPEYYIHRSGRTARAGKTGVSIVFVSPSEENQLRSIAGRYGIELNKEPVPAAEDVEVRIAERMMAMLEELYRERTNLQRERLSRFLPLVRELAAEEPEMLALLVDRLYQDTLHRPPEMVPIPAAGAPDITSPEAEISETEEKPRKKKKRKKPQKESEKPSEEG